MFFPAFLFLFAIYGVFYPLRLHLRNKRSKSVE
jgi:hypothetical protein